MPAGAGVAGGAVTLGTTSAVTVLTAPVTTGSAFAAGAWVWLAGSAWVVGCGAVTVSWTVWGVAGLLVLVAGAAVPFVVFWLAGAGWAVGCDVATVPWTAWVAPWTTPLTAAAVAAEAVVWVAAPAPDAVVAARALAAGGPDAGGAVGGALNAGVLDAGGWLAGCDPLLDPWTALPAAATVDPAVDPAAEATDDTAEVADETTGGTAIGFCAADAGRAKITVRIKPSRKVRARPPLAYKHARRVQVPTFVSPTLEQMGTFPSTARKLRKTLRYLATSPTSVTRW
jgi:hypothetical protein